MRKIILSVVLTLSLSLWANDPGAKDYKSMGESSRPDERGSIGFAIEENREGLVYGLGEEAVFTVTATNGTGGKVSSGKLKVTVSDYTFRPAQTREVDLSRENPFALRGTMAEPGFLRFEIEGEGVPKTVRGAAFAPERIRAAGTCPRDFDAFWSEAKAKLAREVPLDPRLVHVPERSTDTFDFWRVSFATFGGQRVWGFLTVPKDKSRAPFPVRFSISSAGTGRWTWDFESARYQDEVINMSFTVHRFEPPTNQADADRLHKQLAEELKAECGVGSYPVAGFGKSREDAYFYRPILGIDRAVDWLWSRPDVDRRRFIYRGGSQGGGLGMILLGLNHRFTAALLHVPAMMDMLGSEVGRECGFPYLKGYYGNRADRDAAFANAAYYNGAFFASRVTCPVRVSMGFIDDICPPTGVYAAYNELRVKDRRILHGLYRAHGWWPEAEVFEKWLLSLGALAAGIGAGQYDPLMAEKSAIVDTNGVKWIDGRHLPLEGKAFSDVDRFYDRLPSGVTTNVNSGVRSMKSHTAGMQFRFRTTSPFVSFVWCPIGRDLAMTHMPATGMSGIDVYRQDEKGQWWWVKTGFPSWPTGTLNRVYIRPNTPICVNLPLYNGITYFALGIDRNAKVEALGPRKSGVNKPVVFYGTSVTHGGCASRPGMAFPSIVGRALDVPIVNLGFSGSGVMEFEMSEHLARIDASCYVLDCLGNMGWERPPADWKGYRHKGYLRENYEPFIRNLRRLRPDVPIVMASEDDVYNHADCPKNTYLKGLYEKLVAEGWKKLVLLPGDHLLTDDGEGTVDGSHPNDYGMKVRAEAYGAAVRDALTTSLRR